MIIVFSQPLFCLQSVCWLYSQNHQNIPNHFVPLHFGKSILITCHIVSKNSHSRSQVTTYLIGASVGSSLTTVLYRFGAEKSYVLLQYLVGLLSCGGFVTQIVSEQSLLTLPSVGGAWCLESVYISMSSSIFTILCLLF